MNAYHRDKSKTGFTLIELMVVILIIGVLSGMVITVLKPQFFYGKGRDAQRKSDLNSVKAALELYRLDQTDRDFPAAADDATLGSYIQGGSVPTDPGSYSYEYDRADAGDELPSGSDYDKKCFKLWVDPNLESGDSCEVCGGTLTCLQAAGWSGGCECE